MTDRAEAERVANEVLVKLAVGHNRGSVAQHGIVRDALLAQQQATLNDVESAVRRAGWVAPEDHNQALDIVRALRVLCRPEPEGHYGRPPCPTCGAAMTQYPANPRWYCRECGFGEGTDG